MAFAFDGNLDKEMWLTPTFSNVQKVDVESTEAGAFQLDVVSSDGRVLSSGRRDNTQGGWSTFDFHAGMIPPVTAGMSPYRLKFVNKSRESKHLRGNVFT